MGVQLEPRAKGMFGCTRVRSTSSATISWAMRLAKQADERGLPSAVGRHL